MNNILILNPPFVLKRNLSLKWSYIFKVFWILGILSIITLLIFYIFQVNANVSERYLIQKYEKLISEISTENQNLEIRVMQVNSLDNIAELLEPLNLEKTDKIHYIRILDTQVVTK